MEAFVTSFTMTEKTPLAVESSNDEKQLRIRTLNDAFRTSFIGGRVLITPGIQALEESALQELVQKIQCFSDFTTDNDPYGEHDFGAVELDRLRAFWKIDYYDKSMTFGSANPGDPEQTMRVLTVMLAEEY